MFNQTAIAVELADALKPAGGRVWFQGASGTGKTTIVHNLSNVIGTKYSVLYISGDSTDSSVKYAVLKKALLEKKRKRQVLETIASSVIASLHTIPVVGTTAAELVKIAIAAQSAKHNSLLTADQREILQSFQECSDNKQLIIVIDDINLLDIESVGLISNFMLPEVKDAYPFTKKVSILFVESTDSDCTGNSSYYEKLRPCRKFEIPRITQDQFLQALKVFGLRNNLESSLLGAIYSVSGGHLGIAKYLAELLNGAEFDISMNCNETSLMADVLSRRIIEKKGAENLRRLICLAACAGSSFAEKEICYAFMDNDLFAKTLEIALHEEIFSSEDHLLRFSHRLIQSAAEKLCSPESKAMHSKLGECVKLLRPGDYGTRLRHAQLSGNVGAAQELSFVLKMQSIRGERATPSPENDLGYFANIIEDVHEVYKLMDIGKYQDAINIMMKHYTGEYNIVQGEVVILITLNQIKLRTDDKYQAAAGLLEHWIEYKDEPELWQRMMSILITAWTGSGEDEKAAKLYAKLSSDLAQFKDDSTYKNRLEALNRKTDMLLASEIAVKHIERSVSWFAPAKGSIIPRNTFEYTAGLINLSGAHYSLGNFTLAKNFAADATRWISQLRSKGMHTAEPYKAINNYIISAFRCGSETASSALTAVKAAIEQDMSSGNLDRVLIKINYGALALLADKTSDAVNILTAIWNYAIDEDIDKYYALYAGSNLAIALALDGNRQQAREILQRVEPYISIAIPKWYQQAHKKRHSIMTEAIDNALLTSAKSFDDFPATTRTPNNSQDPWMAIGRGLLFSDIQVWTEG